MAYEDPDTWVKDSPEFVAAVSRAVWGAAVDDSKRQGAGVAQFVVGDTSRRTEQIRDLLMEKHAWENQDSVPEEKRGRNGLWQCLIATNGQVYRNAAALARVEEKLDTLIALLDGDNK